MSRLWWDKGSRSNGRVAGGHGTHPSTLKGPDPLNLSRNDSDRFRRVPGNLSKIVQISTIDDFGGPLENPRKIILGRLKLVDKLSLLLFSQDIFWEWAEAATICSSKYCQKVVLGQDVDNLCSKFEPLEECFFRIARGSSQMVDFSNVVDDFPGTLRNPPKSACLQFVFLRVPGSPGSPRFAWVLQMQG